MQQSILLKDISRKLNPELRKSISFKDDNEKAHIITLGNSKYETIPLSLSQDIPDVFL